MIETPNNTDDFILSLLQANNTLAMECLYKHYYKAIYLYLKKFIHEEDDAHDLTQELFNAIWIKRHSLNLAKPHRVIFAFFSTGGVIEHPSEVEKLAK